MCIKMGRRYRSLRGPLMILMPIIRVLSYFIPVNVFYKLVGGSFTCIVILTNVGRAE